MNCSRTPLRRYRHWALALFAWLLTGAGNTSAYNYPLQDRWVATVVGTPAAARADLPQGPRLKQARITIFEDRQVPDRFFYDAELRYSYRLQGNPAPAIFLIAGTGASHNSAKNTMMARAFYQAGYHVILLPSPTTANFVVAASATGVPGHAERDAEDLYRVMEKIWAELGAKEQATSFAVAGYSLGAFNAAFLSKLDEERQAFNFRKVLMINPPVTLYNSISILDRMIENIPGGEDNFNLFYDRLVEGAGKLYRKADRVDMSDDFLYQAYQTLELKNEELAALVGLSFRLSVANMAFVSDVMTDYGYIKPANVTLTRYEPVNDYQQVANRLGFTDYFHEYFLPYYQRLDPGLTRDSAIETMSLHAIADYLRSADKIQVMHNDDDLILAPGEMDFIRQTFGDRATIYPVGGHCGNMEYVDNVRHMVAAVNGEAG